MPPQDANPTPSFGGFGFREAAAERPDLILATEGVLEGYVVGDIIEGRRDPEAMYEVATTFTARRYLSTTREKSAAGTTRPSLRRGPTTPGSSIA